MDNIQEVQLLKENHESLVATLMDLGFDKIDSSTPLSELAEYMKWGGGLRDLRLATLNKNTGAYADYSEEEWNALSASAKASCVKLGIRIRAERQDFIIAKESCLRSNGNNDIPWCENNSTDVKGLTNYGSESTGHLRDIDGKTNTDLILAHGQTNGVRFEAAEQARAYKASTIADGGFDDPTEWSLPAIGQLYLFYKYRKQINAALTTFFGAAYIIPDAWFWSSTEYSSSSAWYVYMNPGYVNNNNKTNTYRVRVVASVPSSAI